MSDKPSHPEHLVFATWLIIPVVYMCILSVILVLGFLLIQKSVNPVSFHEDKSYEAYKESTQQRELPSRPLRVDKVPSNAGVSDPNVSE